MSALLDRGLIRTAAVEQVVAPIECHLCHLVLLCDAAEDPEEFGRLEEAAHVVARATENMAAAASRRMMETEDEILKTELSSLLEPVTVSGQHVLLAAQKLNIQPGLTEHKEELIAATQSVLLGVVRVLQVNDDAAVRKVVSAAEQVLERLADVASCLDVKLLLKAFRAFSDALLRLHRLTLHRANSLQDLTRKQQLLDSLETLKKCLSMLHTAMCTTIKHPTSEQAQAAKRYILDKVQGTVCDAVATLQSEGQGGAAGPCGYYADRRDQVMQVLTHSPASSRSLDSLVRDLVLHCMVVANTSRRDFQQQVVLHCRHILHLWSDFKQVPDADHFQRHPEHSCSLLAEQIHQLDQTMMSAVLCQLLDTFVIVTSVNKELSKALRRIPVEDSQMKLDLDVLQPLVEDFISCCDRIIQVAGFVSAVATDAQSLEAVENSRVHLTRLRAQTAPLSLDLLDGSVQTLQKLLDICRQWEEAAGQLQDAACDVMDVQEFTLIAIREMANDRRGCDEAYREQSYKLFRDRASNLVCHMKMAVHSVRRHLDKSDDPIYRNGLLVLLKQVQICQTQVGQSVRDMLSGGNLNVEAYSSFSDNVSIALEECKVLRKGLDGQKHPHLLSPLRESARRLHDSEASLGEDACDWDHVVRSVSPPLYVIEKELHFKHEPELSDTETIEAELDHKYDSDDLKTPPVTEERRPLDPHSGFDLMPLLNKFLTVTKDKDVTVLNRACTSVLDLSNCYAQAAKEASAIVDAVDRQTLESFRAELVSLTPLLVQTAQETAMNSAKSTESIYRHSTQFSDLINNIRRVLLPVAGSWFSVVYDEVHGLTTQELHLVVNSCADVVQLLTSCDFPLQSDGQETINSLHTKLSKAQNTTKLLVEFVGSPEGERDQLEGLCILWSLSIQILFTSLDKVLGTSTAVGQLSAKKQQSVLAENSMRVQEAARLTSLTCKSAFKAKQLTEYQGELRALTNTYLQAAEDVSFMPSVAQLAKSELTMRRLMIQVRVVSGQLSKTNKSYDSALHDVVSLAYMAARNLREQGCGDQEKRFEDAAQQLSERVKSATDSVEGSLNFIRDSRARSHLRSINDHLSYQISEIISRARLMVETRYVCDTLTLDVMIQCWSAKAHYLDEEIMKQDGIHQEAKENIRAALQGQAPEIQEVVAHVKEATAVRQTAVWQPNCEECSEAAELHLPPVVTYGTTETSKHSSAFKVVTSLTDNSIFLKRESDRWNPEDNRIVQVTRKMADTICYMTQYLKKKGPLLGKEAFVTAAKDVMADSQSATQFIQAIANHCLDKQCADELTLIVEQILTITNQLSIISSVNAVTPGCKSSDEILVKNSQNLLQTVLKGVHAAETACISGLKQPEPNSDGAEATALCFQWKRNLEIHRAQQTSNPDTDELGLRKTSSHPEAPSLASQAQDGLKSPQLTQKTSGVCFSKNKY